MNAAALPRPAQHHGFVLVAVLGALLVIGAVALATLFTASLDSLAARSRLSAVVAREELEGALNLAAAAVQSDYTQAGGASGWLGTQYGPWPAADIGAVVQAVELPAPPGEVIVGLEARLTREPQRKAEVLVMRIHPTAAKLRRH